MLNAPTRRLRATLVCESLLLLAALPTKTPSLSLGHEISPRKRRYALLQGGGHLEVPPTSPPRFFSSFFWTPSFSSALLVLVAPCFCHAARAANQDAGVSLNTLGGGLFS